MDKNKSAYKLKGMGPIYYINLDGQPERQAYMESMFSYWEVENYERISAYDGREDDLSDIIHGRYPSNMSSGEVGCVTSHLKLLKHFLENLILHTVLSWKTMLILVLQNTGTLPGDNSLQDCLMIMMQFNLQ